MRTVLLIATASFILSTFAASAAEVLEPAPDVVVVEPAPVEPLPQESQWEKFKFGARQAGEAVAAGTKNTAHKVADGADRAGDAIVSGSKKAGHAIAEGYEEAKDYVKEKVD